MKIEGDNLRKFLKEVTPDGYKSESYEHGFTDAIIVVNTRLDLLEMQELSERGQGRVELPVSGQLCYIEDAWAYFTTQTLDKQWGDDWNDAPYEHNAGTPYEDDGFKITKVAFEGEFEQPKDGHFNSPFSVEMINKKAIAWLRTSSWKENKDAICAGATFEEFEMFIKRNGGEVYLSR